MYLFEGALSVKAVLLANKRVVEQVVIDDKKQDKDTAFIIKVAKAKGIDVKRANRDAIDELCSGKTHGGVICYADERINDSLDKLKDGNFLCLLEGIEDPFNFGYCLRSLYASGCEGVIVGERNWLDSATTVTKSSSGASENLPIYVSKDLNETLNSLKPRFSILCATRSNALSIYDDLGDQPILLAIGGERRGLSKIVLDHSTRNVYIPYGSDFRNSLNACSAVSVLAFEIMRQRIGKR